MRLIFTPKENSTQKSQIQPFLNGLSLSEDEEDEETGFETKEEAVANFLLNARLNGDLYQTEDLNTTVLGLESLYEGDSGLGKWGRKQSLSSDSSSVMDFFGKSFRKQSCFGSLEILMKTEKKERKPYKKRNSII